jgi:hypothetical protein
VKTGAAERESPILENTEHPTSIGERYRVLKDTEDKGITDEIL